MERSSFSATLGGPLSVGQSATDYGGQLSALNYGRVAAENSRQFLRISHSTNQRTINTDISALNNINAIDANVFIG
jgi:hypothetical protein